MQISNIFIICYKKIIVFGYVIGDSKVDPSFLVLFFNSLRYNNKCH